MVNFLRRTGKRCLKVPAYIYHYAVNAFTKVNRQPVFIFGNQKTGSTAIAALLGQATQKTVTQDIFYYLTKKPWYRLLMQKQISFDTFVDQNRKFFANDIIKEPSLVFHYPQLKKCFPQAHYVFLVRDPRDNIRSILNRLKIPGTLHDLNSEQISRIPGDLWREIINGTELDITGDTYIETMAHRWNHIFSIYQQNSTNMVLLKYEDFNENKSDKIYELATKLGLEAKVDISGNVDTQYQSRGDRSVSWNDFFGSENLQKIEHICRDGIETLGYKQK